jgi:hypothetical protein
LPFDVCVDIFPGLLEIREIGQGMGVWFNMIEEFPPFVFLSGYIKNIWSRHARLPKEV